MVLARHGVVAVLGPAGVVPRLFLAGRSPMGPQAKNAIIATANKATTIASIAKKPATVMRDRRCLRPCPR